MRLAKYFSLVALLVVPFAAQLHAQVLQANIAGSSALWIETGQGAYTQGGTTTTCIWTDKTGTNSFVTDSRVSVNDAGKLWVVWTTGGATCAAPSATALVWAYINLDSTLGNRCLFAQPSCTLNTNDAAGNAGNNPDPLGYADTALPAGVLNAFNGSPITIAATDIMPEDSAFATYQALAPCGALSSGTQYQGYGYGPGPLGTSIVSQKGTTFHVVSFAIDGTDPVSGDTIPAYTITPVGASPVLVFVNTGNASGFGAAGVSNLDRATLGLYFGDILVRTADAIPQTFAGLSATYYGITAWHREPLSGTYNTFDRAIPNNKELYRPQESGNCGTDGTYSVTTNPLDVTRTIADGGTSTTGTQLRAIGTGEMVSQVESTDDSIGYAFWSAGNFSSATYGAGTAGTTKYVTVDGVDPLYSAYQTTNPGEIPTSGNGLLSSVTLQHVADGSYPIWSEQRFATTSSAGTTAAQTLAGWAQTQVSFGSGATQPDFITAPNLKVIRMHFNLPFVTDYTANQGPRVCGSSGLSEAGGDAGGLVTTIQAGSDYAVLKSSYNTSSCVGITNAASFGTHQ